MIAETLQKRMCKILVAGRSKARVVIATGMAFTQRPAAAAYQSIWTFDSSVSDATCRTSGCSKGRAADATLKRSDENTDRPVEIAETTRYKRTPLPGGGDVVERCRWESSKMGTMTSGHVLARFPPRRTHELIRASLQHKHHQSIFTAIPTYTIYATSYK